MCEQQSDRELCLTPSARAAGMRADRRRGEAEGYALAATLAHEAAAGRE